MAASNPHAYKQKLGKVRRILVESLDVQVEHLPIERYGPNLHVVGIEKAVKMIMSEFGYSEPKSRAERKGEKS